MWFWTKKVRTQQQQNRNIKHLNPCRSRELNPGTSRAQNGCVTFVPLSQLRVTTVVKLFICFEAMGRNVNKHSRICGPHIFNKLNFFCNIFTCMDNYIQQFLKFTGVGFTA